MEQGIRNVSSQKKNILHVLVRLDYGGIETWLINILKNYSRDKFQMDICLIGRRGEIGILGKQASDAGSSLFVLPLRNPVHFVREFKQLAAKYEAVLIHTGVHISPLVLWAAYLAGVRTRLIMLHSTRDIIPIRGLDRQEDGLLLNLSTAVCNKLNQVIATGILGCSGAALDQNYPNWRTHHFACVQYLGINLDRFTVDVDRAALRKSLGIPAVALVIGHVGRFNREKNHRNFVCVAKYLSEINPNIHFLLVGDGPLRPDIELQIRDVGLQNRFHLTGLRGDVPDLMKVMDLAYFPSLREGFPMTFIEAQVSGLVLVTGEKPEMSEAVCPENHKWCLVETNEVDKSGERILYLLSNPDLRSQLALRAHKWAIDRFSIKQSTELLERTISQNLESTQGA